MRPSTLKLPAWHAALLAAVAACVWSAFAATAQEERARRDAWQQPGRVMEALHVTTGSRVADVGAGSGYFTFHLARRVGPEGRVYAVDLRESELAKIRGRAERDALRQIEVVRGEAEDPHLPDGTLDAILVVNAYHEMREYEAMMEAFRRALRPGGLLGIIDIAGSADRPRSSSFSDHKIAKEVVREDAERHGLRFSREEAGFDNPERGGWYFLVFQKPEA